VWRETGLALESTAEIAARQSTLIRDVGNRRIAAQVVLVYISALAPDDDETSQTRRHRDAPQDDAFELLNEFSGRVFAHANAIKDARLVAERSCGGSEKSTF